MSDSMKERQYEYLTDDELFALIEGVETHDLVDAPPQIGDKVFEIIDHKKQIIEYKRFRNRVIAAVAAVFIIATYAPGAGRLVSQYVSQNISGYVSVESIGNTHYISDLINGRNY